MNILRTFGWLAVLVLTTAPLWGDEPDALNPFDDKPATPKGAVLGCIELSDGSIHPGWVYLTRDKRLQLVDDKTQQQHEAPLSAVKQIDCAVKKEWMEKEWRFKETTSNEKYVHRSRLSVARVHAHDHVPERPQGRRRPVGRRLPSAAGIHPWRDANRARAGWRPERYILNKRAKGEMGEDLKSLVYVKRIKLGKDAYEEGCKRAARRKAPSPKERGQR